MERADIYAILKQCNAKGAEIDLDDLTFYVGHETVIPRENGKGMVRWQEVLFAAMGRKAERISDYLELPCDGWWRSVARSRFDAERQHIGGGLTTQNLASLALTEGRSCRTVTFAWIVTALLAGLRSRKLDLGEPFITFERILRCT